MPINESGLDFKDVKRNAGEGGKGQGARSKGARGQGARGKGAREGGNLMVRS